MNRDWNKWVDRNKALTDCHEEINFQTDFVMDLVWQVNLTQQVFGQPQSTNVKHGVGVILILNSGIEQLVVASLHPNQAFVQIWWIKNILGLQSQLLSEEWVGVKVSSTHHHNINVMFGPILEEGSITFKLL